MIVYAPTFPVFAFLKFEAPSPPPLQTTEIARKTAKAQVSRRHSDNDDSVNQSKCFAKGKLLKRLTSACLLVAGFCLVNCSESKFSSSNATKGAKGDPGTGTGGPGTGTGEPAPPSGPSQPECIEGDIANFKFSGPAQECIVDKGQTFNFDSNECMKMRKSQFSCSWDGLFDAMKELGVAPTAKLKDFREKGAKLLTCGQAKDESRIVAQMLIPPDGDGFKCEDGKVVNGTVLTGCYENGPGFQGGSEDDRKKYVYSCMNEL